jgi:uncharacterized RmlC-like cupin family protein
MPSIACGITIESEDVSMNRYQPIRVVRPELFSAGTAQTSGSDRRSAIAADQGIEASIWGGLFTVEAGAKTGIHHHGEQETIAYVLEGDCSVRWGEHGEFSATAHAGDFIYVPAQLPHMEINLSHERSFTWVVVRSTATPIVVNLPDDYWDGVATSDPFGQAYTDAQSARERVTRHARFGTVRRCFSSPKYPRDRRSRPQAGQHISTFLVS